MKTYIKLFGCIILFASFMCPCVWGQKKIVSDKTKWKVSFSLFSGERDPYYLLNNDEINKVKEIISREVTPANEVLEFDKDGKTNPDWGLHRYDTPYPYLRLPFRVSVIITDSEGNRMPYDILGRRILVISNGGKTKTLHEMTDNKLEKYLLELAYKKEIPRDVYLSPKAKEQILNSFKSFIYEDSRRNRE